MTELGAFSDAIPCLVFGLLMVPWWHLRVSRWDMVSLKSTSQIMVSVTAGSFLISLVTINKGGEVE